jgi:hypothetical protein
MARRRASRKASANSQRICTNAVACPASARCCISTRFLATGCRASKTLCAAFGRLMAVRPCASQRRASRWVLSAGQVLGTSGRGKGRGRGRGSEPGPRQCTPFDRRSAAGPGLHAGGLGERARHGVVRGFFRRRRARMQAERGRAGQDGPAPCDRWMDALSVTRHRCATAAWRNRRQTRSLAGPCRYRHAQLEQGVEHWSCLHWSSAAFAAAAVGYSDAQSCLQASSLQEKTHPV